MHQRRADSPATLQLMGEPRLRQRSHRDSTIRSTRRGRRWQRARLARRLLRWSSRGWRPCRRMPCHRRDRRATETRCRAAGDRRPQTGRQPDRALDLVERKRHDCRRRARPMRPARAERAKRPARVGGHHPLLGEELAKITPGLENRRTRRGLRAEREYGASVPPAAGAIAIVSSTCNSATADTGRAHCETTRMTISITSEYGEVPVDTAVLDAASGSPHRRRDGKQREIEPMLEAVTGVLAIPDCLHVMM